MADVRIRLLKSYQPWNAVEGQVFVTDVRQAQKLIAAGLAELASLQQDRSLDTPPAHRMMTGKRTTRK